MKSALAFLSAIVLAAASANAQYAVQSPPSYGVAGMEQLGPGAKQAGQQSLAIVGTAPLSACPISMEARQGGGLHMLRAGKDGKLPSQPAMEPSLTLQNPKGKQIVFATITARGFGANKGSTLLDTKDQDQGQDRGLILRGNNASPQRTHLMRTLTVKFQPDDINSVSGDFHLPGFVVLESIELNSVTYADDTVWNVAKPQSCRVKPSPLMLVGGNQ